MLTGQRCSFASCPGRGPRLVSLFIDWTLMWLLRWHAFGSAAPAGNVVALMGSLWKRCSCGEFGSQAAYSCSEFLYRAASAPFVPPTHGGGLCASRVASLCGVPSGPSLPLPPSLPPSLPAPLLPQFMSTATNIALEFVYLAIGTMVASYFQASRCACLDSTRLVAPVARVARGAST